MPLNLAIIFAREGSKRLLNKSIKLLFGKSLILRAIEAALESELFDMVLVSTDSQEIANVALVAGASIAWLKPAELASNTATMNDAINHTVYCIESYHGRVYLVARLQPTFLLRNSDNIREAIALYNEKKGLAVISVCELDHPIQYCNRIPVDRSMNGFLPKYSNQRSQDLEFYYRLNGAIYIFEFDRKKYVGALSKRYSVRSFAYIMRKNNSIDMGDEYDLKMATHMNKLAC